MANDTTILNGISDEVDSKVDVDMAAFLGNKMKAIADMCERFGLILPAIANSKSGQSSAIYVSYLCRELDFVFVFYFNVFLFLVRFSAVLLKSKRGVDLLGLLTPSSCS